LNLSVTGVSLKPQSPLLGTDEEVEAELIKGHKSPREDSNKDTKTS